MLCYTATRDCLPIPPKKNSPCIPPAPSCTAETKSGKKGISRGFANHFSRKIASQNRVRISFRHLPEYLEGRTPKEKHPFLFQKKFHPRQIKKARSVFLSGLPRLCEAVAERFIPHRDFVGKKFGFCSGDTAKFQNSFFRQNSERRKATRLGFPPESAKGF